MPGFPHAADAPGGAIHDGTTQPALDTSQGLVSALGGQDVHALDFTGAEIMPKVQGTSLILQDGDESNPDGGPVSWASHPSAIGYRRAGYISTGSGSGSGSGGGSGLGSGGSGSGGGGSGGGGSSFAMLSAVSPEFDSGMNDGSDGQELNRLQNFYGGTEENPTVAQSAPTPRAQVQVNATSAPAGGGPSLDGIMDPSNDNPPWRAGANPYSGHGYYNPFVGWFGWGGSSPSTSTTLDYGPSSNSTGTQTLPDPGPPSAPERAPSGGGGGGAAQGRPPLYPPGYVPGPGRYSSANDPEPSSTEATSPPEGSQIDPASDNHDSPASPMDSLGNVPANDPVAQASSPPTSDAPSYDDHWSDWINLFSWIDWGRARFASNGDKVGFMLGSMANNSSGGEKARSIAEQNKVYDDLSHDNISLNNARQQVAASRQRETKEIGENAVITADGAQAAAELASDTVMVLEAGIGLLGAVRPRPRLSGVPGAPNAKAPLRYKLGPNDVDWRGTGKTVDDALSDAFSKTGLPRSEFEVTKWGKDKYGKSFPAEWRHPSGAEVNIDFPHIKNGPDAPHVGWQTGGKRGSGGAQRGHTILDDVPYNR